MASALLASALAEQVTPPIGVVVAGVTLYGPSLHGGGHHGGRRASGRRNTASVAPSGPSGHDRLSIAMGHALP